MATTHTHDLVVKTGEYKNSAGEMKNRYINIGKVLKGDNGAYIIIDRTFNPAGVPNPDNKEGLIVSLFEVKKNDGARNQASAAPSGEEDVPF